MSAKIQLSNDSFECNRTRAIQSNKIMLLQLHNSHIALQATICINCTQTVTQVKTMNAECENEFTLFAHTNNNGVFWVMD